MGTSLPGLPLRSTVRRHWRHSWSRVCRDGAVTGRVATLSRVVSRDCRKFSGPLARSGFGQHWGAASSQLAGLPPATLHPTTSQELSRLCPRVAVDHGRRRHEDVQLERCQRCWAWRSSARLEDARSPPGRVAVVEQSNRQSLDSSFFEDSPLSVSLSSSSLSRTVSACMYDA